METVFDVVRSLQLNFSQAVGTGLVIFVLGYLAGTIKIKKLTREKHGLEKAVMALNEELLYGTPSNDPRETESSTPVIGLKPKNLKSSTIAK